MQPRRPQVHGAPSIFTTMWPISPAAPRPTQGLPPRMIPPPTPVPHQTPSSDLTLRPAPSAYSPSTATCTSLPSSTGQPTRSDSAPASGNDSSQSGRFPAPATLPVSASTAPGEPTPTP